MDFTISGDLKDFKDLARQICEDELKPVVLELDRKREYPREFLKLIGKTGFMGVWIPEEYGGAGCGLFGLALLAEEIARVCVGTATAYSAIALGTLPVLLSGTEAQKQKYLTKVANGEYIAGFALTEASSGTDAFGGMQTKAVRDGDFYIINGTKQFISNASQADFYSVFAKTNPNGGPRGVSGFIVDKDTPGLSFGLKLEKLGLHCSDTREVVFENCRVPKENLIGGKEGLGIRTVIRTLNKSRVIGGGAHGVGCAQGAYEEALRYAKNRKLFGKRIIDFQVNQHKFANIATEIEMARLMVYEAAWMLDQNLQEHDAGKYAAMAKCAGSDAAMHTVVEAMQIFAGAGYMDSLAAKFYRDAKVLQIYEGTNEVQRDEIARNLMREK
ncbi:hypothetical protein A2662_00770 [Candidatus Giovannonibacteria bacterium RIFCSPHIGHO2_01_FULL_45_33]|uniref:Acyl-CoA dehydrogenase n=1 Tax=Candidatus Giovannonibacteria bacterium RIFCSPLOWO2_01_FULL_45_34 TaxID=1798351 RepID=A0A1F5WY12_9BACT|nr:MAG: hypothetical protein A2662_00770 [Candidatus Giovannonibacteria bacterium RIFCSPHIGHO2_01_FULL_45_33]OGF68998.1 MAG: hypothetical protein A3C73_04740 [Candidatus Giovannonibacteria bacterium RIFCSPHIGHO2_02_FULL_44_11]OGF80510.1 MAG: hypothetical protein A2930_02665 [Candidatus Giovannonibacteria bacterium RIFCSPLOWO2_01_FULL_45_34]